MAKLEADISNVTQLLTDEALTELKVKIGANLIGKELTIDVRLKLVVADFGARAAHLSTYCTTYRRQSELTFASTMTRVSI